MGMSDLPDMYAQSPRAIGPRAEGYIHTKQITSAHVTITLSQQAVLKLRVELNCSNYIYGVASKF